jgi:hypothetical protein
MLKRGASDKEAGVPGLDQRAALEWIARWDEQQQEHLPDREDRFTALIDGVEEGAGQRGNNRILCGVRGG